MMKGRMIGLVLCVAFVCGVSAQEPPADPIARAFRSLRAGKMEAALVQMEDISNPAAKLFVQASVERARGETEQAIETMSRGIALYPNDPNWTAKSELMCAALYLELDMLDAAESTVRHMQLFHEGSAMADKAAFLQSKIEKMRAEQAAEAASRRQTEFDK